jgi:hypothetical protein
MSALRLLAVLIWLGSATSAGAAASLDEARAAFMTAYNGADFAGLCNALDKDASFRGSVVVPPTWTHTADRIIKDRWRSDKTCTQLRRNPKTTRKLMHPRTVGERDLALTPAQDAATVKGSTADYAIDTGRFAMVRKATGATDELQGQYVILWIKEGDDWKIKQIDMQRSR